MIATLIFILGLYLFFTNRKDYSLFLLFYLITAGFWIEGRFTGFFGMSLQLNDFGLLYLFFIMLYKFFTNKLESLPSDLKIVNYFVFFLFVSMLVDYFMNSTPFGDILATSRHWLFVLFVYLLPYYSKEDIKKGLQITVYFTLIQITLFLTEPLTGIVLFSYDGTAEALSIVTDRYALAPPLIIFIFSWVYSTEYISKPKKNLFILLILMAMAITLIRSWIIAVVMIFILSIFISKKESTGKKLLMIIGLFLFVVSISFYEPIANRFEESIGDISSINKNSKEVEGNMSFRLLLAGERLNYILKEMHTTVFGIGFISEQHYRGHFIYGLWDDDGFVVQLNTADIAWALFYLRLGLLGTILYLLIYYKFLKYFWKYRSNSVAIGGFYYLLMNLFLSLSGIAVAQGSFIVIPALLYKLVKESKK